MIHAMAAAAFLFASAPNVALMAQGLDAEGAIDTIVGSDVRTAEEAAADDQDRLLGAIGNTSANISEVRKKFSLDAMEIIFLPDLAEQDAVAAKIAETEQLIVELRQAIEGSAMFYHAVNSKGVLLRDIVALEFDDDNGVTIFVSGTSPE
jgi:hypothetical protein